MTETPDGGPQGPQQQPHPHIPPQPGRHPDAGPGGRGPVVPGAGLLAAGAPGPGAAPGPQPIPTPAVQLAVDRRGGGRRLVAVAAVTAVLGGLVGGGAVAAVDPGGTTPVTAAGITVDGGTAPTVATRAGTVEAAAATAAKSVVTLTVRGGSESGTGSGVIVRADGYILTNEHVVAAGSGGTSTVTFVDGRTATATLVGSDRTTDLAVVKVDGISGLTAATFADSDAVKVGQTVVAVGSPLGLDGTVTQGIVSALHRPTTGGSDGSAVIDALQTDAAINQGSSGGALVDLAGRVVGINQSIATASSGSGGFGQQSSGPGNVGIGFAIPADTAARIAQQLIATGTASHAYLGVRTSDTSSETATSTGATLASVESGGPAADAGLQAGDVVTKVDGRVVTAADELVAAVRSSAPGEKLTLTVARGGAEQTVTVTLGSDARQ